MIEANFKHLWGDGTGKLALEPQSVDSHLSNVTLLQMQEPALSSSRASW